MVHLRSEVFWLFVKKLFSIKHNLVAFSFQSPIEQWHMN